MSSKLIPANGSFAVDTDPIATLAKEEKVAKHFAAILDELGFDWKNDHNTRDTPKRVAKMFCREILAGSFSAPPAITFFENPTQYDQLICTGPIVVRSTCAHHLMPITGHAYIGVLPNLTNGKIVGLSKYARIIRWFSARLQIQEELTSQIADFLENHLQPEGLAVRIVAKHHCVSHRGIQEHGSVMDTSIMRGALRRSPGLKQEFLESCRFMQQSARGD